MEAEQNERPWEVREGPDDERAVAPGHGIVTQPPGLAKTNSKLISCQRCVWHPPSSTKAGRCQRFGAVIQDPAHEFCQSFLLPMTLE